MTVMDTGTPDVYPTRTSTLSRCIHRTHPTVWPVCSGPISPVDLATYSRKGFHIIPELLDAGEVQHYWDELGRLCTDPGVLDDERTVVEKSSRQVRSIFEVHKISDLIGGLVSDPRVVARARQILGTEVYLHQTRINLPVQRWLDVDARFPAMFDCNIMHGSGNNITPFPRSNIFTVSNSVANTLVMPYSAPSKRPNFVASRNFTPIFWSVGVGLRGGPRRYARELMSVGGDAGVQPVGAVFRSSDRAATAVSE